MHLTRFNPTYHHNVMVAPCTSPFVSERHSQTEVWVTAAYVAAARQKNARR